MTIALASALAGAGCGAGDIDSGIKRAKQEKAKACKKAKKYIADSKDLGVPQDSSKVVKAKDFVKNHCTPK